MPLGNEIHDWICVDTIPNIPQCNISTKQYHVCADLDILILLLLYEQMFWLSYFKTKSQNHCL